MSETKFIYEFPRPMVTVDAVLFASSPEGDSVLLVQRKHPPFADKWALPGGFIDMEEPLDRAVARELQEETGLTGVRLEQFRTYGDPGRDPRGRTISVVYAGLLDAPQAAQAADDAADARWWPLAALPELAFDHALIVEQARDFHKRGVRHGED